jgi:hypothetical protein
MISDTKAKLVFAWNRRAALAEATPEEPDAAGLYHRNVHREVGRARAAKTVKVGGKDAATPNETLFSCGYHQCEGCSICLGDAATHSLSQKMHAAGYTKRSHPVLTDDEKPVYPEFENAATEAQPLAITEEMIDRAAREGYAVRCKTNGPRTLAQYASEKIMRAEHENARVIAATEAQPVPSHQPTGDQLRAIVKSLGGSSTAPSLSEAALAGWNAAMKQRSAAAPPKREAEVTDEQILELAHEHGMPVKTLSGHFPWAYIDPLIDFARALLSRSHDQREGWVSVPKQLPERNVAVLVATEFDRPGDWRIKVGYLDRHTGWEVFGASWIPSHWQPLPAAPKTSGGEK